MALEGKIYHCSPDHAKLLVSPCREWQHMGVKAVKGKEARGPGSWEGGHDLLM